MISIGNLKIVESGSVAANILSEWYIRKFDEQEFEILFKESTFVNFLEEYGSNLNDLVFAGIGKSMSEDKWSGTPEISEMWEYYRRILLQLNLFFKFPVFLLHELEVSRINGRIGDIQLPPPSDGASFTRPYYVTNASYLFSRADRGGMHTYNWQNELPAEELPRIEQFTSKLRHQEYMMLQDML